jgi:hypothetical protein
MYRMCELFTHTNTNLKYNSVPVRTSGIHVHKSQVHLCANMCIWPRVHTCTHTHTYIHTHIHTYIHTYIHAEPRQHASWAHEEILVCTLSMLLYHNRVSIVLTSTADFLTSDKTMVHMRVPGQNLPTWSTSTQAHTHTHTRGHENSYIKVHVSDLLCSEAGLLCAYMHVHYA